MRDPQPVFLGNGSPATRGVCAECGTRLTRLGRTPAHEEGRGVQLNAPTMGAPQPERPQAGDCRIARQSAHGGQVPGQRLLRSRPRSATSAICLQIAWAWMWSTTFAPRYVIPEKKKDVVKALRQDAKSGLRVFLATDPDREGEAISWHLEQALAREIAGKPVQRVEFHEITRDAVDHAFANPRDGGPGPRGCAAGAAHPRPAGGLQAQPAVARQDEPQGLERGAGAKRGCATRRRARARDPGLCAGRVLEHRGGAGQANRTKRRSQSFRAKLIKINGQDADLKTRDDTLKIVAELEKAAYVVTRVDQREKRRYPCAAVHDEHAATRSVQAIGLCRQAHDGRGAVAVRRRGHRRRSARGPHHVHAHRQHRHRPGRPGRSARRDREKIRRRIPAALAARSTRPKPKARKKRTRPSVRPPLTASRPRSSRSSTATSTACTI